MYSQGICPAALLAGPRQIWFCSSLPFSPAVSLCNKAEETVATPLFSVNTVIRRGGKTLRVNMVLKREDDRILGGLESTLSDGLNHILQHIKIRRTLQLSSHRGCKQQRRIPGLGSIRSLWHCSEQQHQRVTPK